MLALTFTRAAGAEMKERVIGLIGPDGKKLFCNTFHAFCVEILREYAERLGYEPNFTVYDQTECDELLKEILADLRLKIPLKRVAEARAGKYGDMTVAARRDAERAVKEYEYRLRRSNALDFDELIATVKCAVNEDREIREVLQSRYRYVFVDEFQDTDPEQWVIVQSLAPDNLFVVGDDFQSIYSFRGSDVGIILSLANSLKWQTVKLETNYRSTMPVIKAANTLIRHNLQTEKKLVTDRDGVAVDFREPESDYREITDIIGRLMDNMRLGRTTAVLARTNRQIDNAKAILTGRNVPCETLAAAGNPLTSKEARELLTWIAAIANPNDDVAMRKIAATKMSKAAILETEKRQLNMLSGVGIFCEALSETDAGRDFIDTYLAHAQSFEVAQDLVAGALVLTAALGIEANGAINEISRWQQMQADLGESATAVDLLNYVRLSDVVERPAQVRDASKTYLMTVHGSKGLEFDEVFIIGAAQGKFPGKGDIEEERRLFYVAITRAREYLNMSCPQMMTDWGGHPKQTEISQFVSEAMAI
jgi:DNA helicase-2/ATP-dependent DNA helicase PcrA